MEYAVVIGIDHYKSRPLTGAVNDAKAFAGWLSSAGLVAQEKNLKLLTSNELNEIAMGHEIDKAIDEVITDAKAHNSEKNRLYFYFSGHGLGITYDNTALCLREWPGWFHHCLSGADYRAWFTNKAVFDEILIFLDCCRESDVFASAKSPAPDWKNPIGTKNPDILICNSTLYKKLSYEIQGPDAKRGAFTSFLIEALKGDADPNGKGAITALDLKNHVDANFESYALKNNKVQKGDIYTMGATGNSMVICTVAKKAAPFDCEITFDRTSTVSLLGPDLDMIREGSVITGDIWRLKLGKGLFLLRDAISGETKSIVNYSDNTMSHESF